MARGSYYPGTRIIFLKHMIQSLILAGSPREYNRYLRTYGLDSRDNPQLSNIVQLKDYHELPPVVIVGSWADRYSHIYQQLMHNGADLINANEETV